MFSNHFATDPRLGFFEQIDGLVLSCVLLAVVDFGNCICVKRRRAGLQKNGDFYGLSLCKRGRLRGAHSDGLA
jgi:hypothetical protein